jgi:chaperonin cofactor prefoldin
MKKAILDKIKKSLCNTSNAKNGMSCLQDYRDPYYIIGKTFTETELNKLSEKELNSLVNFAEVVNEVVY